MSLLYRILGWFNVHIISDPATVDRVLKNKDWQMAGPVGKMLGPLLGEGIILVTNERHLEQRRTVGRMTMPNLKGMVDKFVPTQGPCDLNAEMLRLVESVIGSMFGVPELNVGHLVRMCVRLAPARLLGIPLDWYWLSKLNKELASMPTPAFLENQVLTAKEKRDWLASFIVAGLDTLSSDLTAQLVGASLLPIWWLPRRNEKTGELAILLLTPEHKFGAGFRRCVGEAIAKQLTQIVKDQFTVEVVEVGKPSGLITRRLSKAIGILRRKTDATT